MLNAMLLALAPLESKPTMVYRGLFLLSVTFLTWTTILCHFTTLNLMGESIQLKVEFWKSPRVLWFSRKEKEIKLSTLSQDLSWLILLHSPPRHQNRPYSIAACSLGKHKWERNDNSKQGLLYSEVTGKLDFCDHCALGKQKRVSFSIARHLLKVPLITFILIYGSI